MKPYNYPKAYLNLDNNAAISSCTACGGLRYGECFHENHNLTFMNEALDQVIYSREKYLKQLSDAVEIIKDEINYLYMERIRLSFEKKI
jgi:hypothetical protein